MVEYLRSARAGRGAAAHDSACSPTLAVPSQRRRQGDSLLTTVGARDLGELLRVEPDLPLADSKNLTGHPTSAPPTQTFNRGLGPLTEAARRFCVLRFDIRAALCEGGVGGIMSTMRDSRCLRWQIVSKMVQKWLSTESGVPPSLLLLFLYSSASLIRITIHSREL